MRVTASRFVDNHCHILPTGLDLYALDLSSATNGAEVLDLVRDFHWAQAEGWLLAIFYDQNRYGGAHLTRHDLDKVSSDRPILLRHSSRHAGVVNSAALQAAKVEENSSSEIEGFVRGEDGKLSGLLLENAFSAVEKAIPPPTHEQMVGAILRACDSMAGFGICCASDLQTGFLNLEDELSAYREAAIQGAKVAMRLYLQWGRVFSSRGVGLERLKELMASFEGTSCRIQGVKLFADGAIGAGTAAIHGSYADVPGDRETTGILMYDPEKLKKRVTLAAGHGLQVAVHAIGDRACDVVMDAFEATEDPSRHRIEHAMLLSDAQIERLRKLDPFVTLQPEFLHSFGATYLRKLGPERASKIIRARSLMEAGLKVSFSSDRPVTSGDPAIALQCAVSRPDGFDPVENVRLEQAELGHTLAGAQATFDENLALP